MFLKKALAFILSASMALSAAVLPTTASADETSVTIANFDKLYQNVWGGKEQDGHLDSTAGGTVVYAGVADLAGDMTVTLGWGLASGYKVDASVYAMPLLDTDSDGTATAEETDAYYAALSDKPSFTDASANLLASITDYNEGAGWTTYKDVELTTSANSLSGKKAIFFTLSNDGKNNTNGYTGNFTYLNISATNVLGTPAGTCAASVTLKSELAADADAVFNVDVIYYGTSIKSGTVTLESGATTATASITDVPVYSEGAEYTVSITPVGYDFVVDSYDGTITAAVDGTHAVSADIYKVENTSVTLDDTFQASSNTKADLDLIAKAVAKGAESSDLEASEIITVEYDFVPGSASAHGYIDLRANAGADSCSENTDSKRYLITRIYSGWNQVDVADGATKFGGVSDIDNHQKLNIAGKYNSNPTDTYHIKYTINYRTKTMQLDASSTSGSTSAFEFTGFPSADKGSLYMSLYPDTVTEKNTWTVSNVKVGYKTAATDSGEPAAKTGKVTTTIDRKVKTVTFTKGDTVKTIDATKYYSELQYIEGVDVKTKDIELTFDEADFGEYAITTEAYAPSTFELISKIGGEAVTKVTVGDGSDIALTVSGDVITTAPTTDYTKVKTSTVIWDMKRDKAWSPATIQYIDAVQGKENTYIAGALSDNTSAETDVYLIADTTSGKIQTWGRGDWMQVNDGTKFKIPAMKDTKITVTSYGTMTGTADEKSFTAANTYEYYYVGADNGLSELNFTSAGGYLGYIKTEPVTRKTVALTVTGETTGTLKFADDASGDVVYASVTDENVALLPGQTYTITYGTMEDSTFTPSEDKHVTNETKSFTVGDSTTAATVTIEGGAAAKTGKVTLTMDSHVKKVTLVDKTDNTKKIELVSGVNTIEEDAFGEYDVVSTAIAPATYTLTTNPSTVTIAENSDIAIEVKGAIRTSDLPTTDYDVVKANTIEWTVVNATTSRPSSHIDVALQNKGDVAVAGAIQGQTDDAEVYMIVNTTTGKFNTRDSNNGYTQLNEGTVLKVPVAKDTKITLDGYGELKMSVDDETVSGNPIVYYYVGDANSYVNLTQGSGSNIWLKSVTTEPMPRKTVAVTATGGTDGDCVKFTNDVTGDVQYGTIASSAASVSLLQGFTYAVDYGTKDGETFTASETKALENDSKSLAVSSSTDTATLTVKTLDPSTKHTITIDPSITHGTITTTPAAKADEDTEVTIAAARDENYKLKAGSVKVTKTGDETTEVEVTDGKFIMPAYDVTVTAEFEASTETEGQLYVNGAYTSLETDATHFKTISEAVAAAKVINPQSEQNRVVINVYPGDYEEQVRMDQMKYVTLQQTPETNGKVNLSWYFCTNYYTSNTDLNGQYDPKIDWSLDETWNGYNEGDEEFTKYTIGQDLSGVSKISYYDTDGVKHKDVAKNSMLDRLGGLAWSYDKMAPLIVTSSSSDITIKDLNLINSTVVMKTKGQDDGHLTPNPSGNLPDHKALSICDETTTLVKPTADIFDDGGSVNLTKYKAYVASQGADFKFTPGESAWLLQSSGFNERGHAIAILGDRIICENIRVRGNQDSVWVSDGRTYFKNCDLIGGRDYIFGSASAVFDHCMLGFVGFTDKSYGSPLATPNT
ncbi:MAG: hypothetical protein IJG16_02730, partial [Clostridia bacterium]|nr:hypothetical protein [Clostridia bacterium]